MYTKLITYILFFSLGFLFSCKKDPVEPMKKQIVFDTNFVTRGIYVLNEGLMNMNNASLSYFNFADSSTSSDYFNMQNGRKLGDTGNDLAVYGQKIYVVVCVSSQVEVLDAVTGKSIVQIPLFNGQKPRQPRRIAFYKQTAIVCSFDGSVAIIDTASLTVEKYIQVGRNPDGIAVANNKAYISNSGGLDAPKYGHTLSVIDMEKQEVVKEIEVEVNPYLIVPDDYGDLYVISRGDYGKKKMCLQIVDSKTDSLKYTFPNLEALNLAIHGDTAYVYHYDFTSGSGSAIRVLNIKTKQIIRDNFISDGTKVQTAYGIVIDKATGNVFIGDAHGFVNTGDVICFNSLGKKQFSFKTGLNPCGMVILNEMQFDTTQSKR